MTGFEVRPLPGIGEVSAGDDLGTLIEDALATAGRRLADGDVVAVASKVISKAEGRVRHGTTRDAAIDEETVRVVAERGRTRIVQTRHGFVMAAAGVDESNVEAGSVVLLPLDPDASARALRAELARRTGTLVGVLITDTFGRPWRLGQTDLAVGAAGVQVLEEYAGRTDAYGNPLVVTAPALADELAAAADLARTKLSATPVAIVSGLGRMVTAEDGPGVRAQVRTADEDLFRLGTREAIRSAAALPRTAPSLTDAPVDAEPVRRIVAQTLDAARGERTAWATGAVLLPVERASERKPMLDVLGMPTSVPYLLVGYAPGQQVGHRPTGTHAAALLELGALLDRVALALTAEGFGVWRAEPDQLARVAGALGDLPGASPGAEPVALLAVGAGSRDA